MPQTILSHMLSLVNHHDVPFKDAAACTALRFKVSVLYVETLFYRGL
jgi:hypothetical protein